MTCKFFFVRLSASVLYCECGRSFEQGASCRSIWAVTANRSGFSHPKFGNNLACSIVKKIVHRDLIRQEAPKKLYDLFSIQCSKGKHVVMKQSSKKKKVLACQICEKRVVGASIDIPQKPPSCGLQNPSKPVYCENHGYLCEYSTQKYAHKCHCILCNKNTSSLLSYFNLVRSQLNISKCNFSKKEICFKIEFWNYISSSLFN